MPESGPQVFNNADSFGQAFDEAWQHLKRQPRSRDLSPQETLAEVLEAVADHPFAVHDPRRARQVADFRIRLLGL
ncbi:MAG: hypothetical protein VKK62_08195 [Synechococcaceae cyanobacterium]|nr:hypothetical protein [Synechococcaceae cyanobacterium]